MIIFITCTHEACEYGCGKTLAGTSAAGVALAHGCCRHRLLRLLGVDVMEGIGPAGA